MLTVDRFRWAACQLDALEQCLDRRSLRKALASLPETLDETYGRIISSIPDTQKLYAIRILQFLTYSERPLRIEEAVDAIAVETKEDPYFDIKDRLPDPREISCYCSSLVVVMSAKDHSYDKDDKPMELQLAHFSVKEYLTSDRLDNDIAQKFQEAVAKASIATVCLAYLLHLDLDLPAKELKKTFPLAQYCARYWITFAAVAESKDETLQGFIREFFYYRKSSYRNCYSLYRPDRSWEDEPAKGGKEPAPALYYASFGGLINAVKYLLSRGADVNAQGGEYGNALQAASVRGHEKVVELLLSKGADVNAQGGSFGNALQAASTKGHEKVVELLLSKGADINAQDRSYGNVLLAALYGSHVVEPLLRTGIDINAEGGRFGNALQAASVRGHEKVAELLLSKGADINAQGGYYGNALQAASYGGHEKVVELLLSKGADINAQGGRYSNALQAASVGGHKKVAELLLSRNAVS
jgi:ankyrin repeat protein